MGDTGRVSWANGPALGVNPVDGSQHIGFNGGDAPPGGSISQGFSTAIGQTFTVSFSIGRIGPGGGTMSLRAQATSAIGTVLGSLTAVAPSDPGYGPVQTFSFTATTTNSVLMFEDTSSATVAVDLLLDNVRVEASGGGCMMPPSGLVSWWRAENDIADAVGGNDGTRGGDTTFAPGKVGRSFKFDGNGDGISVGNPASLRLQEFTIESWVQRGNATLVSAGSIFGEIVGYGFGGYVFGFWSEGNLFLSKHGIDEVTSTRAITDTDWHHVAVTKAGDKVVFYIDGVAESEALYTTTFEFTSDLTIGAVNNGFDASFLGSIDELSIYNRALAAVEVRSIFTAGVAGKCAPPLPGGRAVAHWKFDETSGTVAHDSAGSFDGTLSPGGSSFVPGGISGNGISLSKAGQGFVDMGSVLGMESGDFSVVAWVKMSAGDTTECSTIVSKQRAGYANGYVIAVNRCGGPTAGYAKPGKAWFYDSDYQGQEITSKTSVNDGHWHQIVGVYEAGGNKSIYVDGVTAEATNSSRPIVANPGRLLMGGVDFDGTPASAFTGLIDEVQIL